MKFKTTKKEILNFYPVTIKTSYCAIQHLLQYQNEIAYTCGVYGWNADIYNINGIAICTGYRPFGTVFADYDICDKYDRLARELVNDWNMEHETKKEKVNNLLNEFISEVLKK